MDWILCQETHVIEASETDYPIRCPQCKGVVSKAHLKKVDKDASNEDTQGWHYLHSCGAKLLIIND